MKTVIFVGRFQPFHKGHKHAIEDLKDNYKVKIVIGSSKSEGTFENPLNSEERKEIISKCFPELEISEIPDFPSDDKWTEKLIRKTEFDLAVSGNSHTRKCLKEFGIEVKKPDILKPEKYKGELIRGKIVKGKEWKDSVPECALGVLDSLGFEERVRKIAQ